MTEINYNTDRYDKRDLSHLEDNLGDVLFYEKSIRRVGNCWYLMIKKGIDKYLIIAADINSEEPKEFEGKKININSSSILKCELTSKNANALRSVFDYTNPVLIGKINSYGFGDRLGNAGPAHLRSVRDTGFKPVLAQQSIRELNRTNRTAREVMDAASWAVFQEGHKDGFGADADHLKTTDDIDRMVKAGFTMFTIDPGDYVVNEAKKMNLEKLKKRFLNLPWTQLKCDPVGLLKRYSGKKIVLNNDTNLNPDDYQVLQGMVKYGRVILHTKMMADYLKNKYPDHPTELELSVDETDSPTTPFEHFLIASELNRLGVELVSLAPRFCGDFEKGIDFKGDLDQFRSEYKQHLAIAERVGGYKLSIHSGSDKFSVYEVIGSINSGAVHVKTAGTSYLEALRTIAEAEPALFREILAFSVNRFNEDKKTYHISANPDGISSLYKSKEKQLTELLNDNDVRQVLHVAYGSVLSGNLPEAATFKERLMKSLEEHENLYEKNLSAHFNRHFESFN